MRKIRNSFLILIGWILIGGLANLSVNAQKQPPPEKYRHLDGQNVAGGVFGQC